MEIILLFVGWIVLLYIIHLNKELNAYRKYQHQHDEIYVPSLNEMVNHNHWSLQLVRLVFSRLNTIEQKSFRIVFPYVKKKLSYLSFVTVRGLKKSD